MLLPKGSEEYSLYPLSLKLPSSLNEMKRLSLSCSPSLGAPARHPDTGTHRHHGTVSGMGANKPLGTSYHFAWHRILPSDFLWSPPEPARPFMGVYPPENLACRSRQNLWKVSWSNIIGREKMQLIQKCNNLQINRSTMPTIARRVFSLSMLKSTRWAVVTGCTGGIGRAYVLAMAAKGMDIVLVI